MKQLALVLAVCLLWMLAQCADASIRQVRPGEVPELGADEGLLVVDVDTTVGFGILSIAHQGHMFGGETIRNVRSGRSAELYVVSAGDYRWDRITESLLGGSSYFDLSDDPEFRFQVKPGVINYTGDLLYRPSGLRAQIHTANRGLSAIDWLRAYHPGVYAKYRFSYSGHYADPFPDFYATERAAVPSKTDADLTHTLEPPWPGTLPIPIEDIWREQRVRAISLNSRGDLLAETIYEKESWHVDLIDLKAGQQQRLLNTKNYPRYLEWNGDQVLLVTTQGSADSVDVMHIGEAGPKGRPFSQFWIPKDGDVLSPGTSDPDHVLFQSEGMNGMQVHRLDISDAKNFDQQQFAGSDRINRGVDNALTWITDASGALRGAIARQGDRLMLFHGGNGIFHPVLDITDESGFRPLLLSPDGNIFYGLIEKGRDQRELVEFDPATEKIGRTLFSKPGRDVEAVRTDGHGRLVGAAYYENGLLNVGYFDQRESRIDERLAQAFPGLEVTIVDRDDGERNFIVEVQGSDHPMQVYHFDLDHSTAELVEDSAPWLAGKQLAQAHMVHAKGADGLEIEAYLTLPPHTEGKMPLIVYSHGGPIGVRDNIGFDPAVQLFASLGYAVLQVNFRGSEGYGRAFREAGRHHYGSLIEDDIDAATRTVMAGFPIDPDRLCAVGASYGGYSALVSAIRWPKRFRCAVSIAGVSDQTLMFTASDASWSAADRKEMELAIGNPATDADAMRSYSPLYRYKELAIPVMLAHGTEDQRVDYEHSLRLIRMLNLAGRPPVMMTFKGEGHGGFSHKDELALWTGVAGFLREHLDVKATTPAR